MIGIVTGGGYVAFEFRPIFASDKMKWAKIVIKTKLVDSVGEYGIAFTTRKEICVFWGHEMHFRDPFNLFKKC
jgi:hypothetical protein